MDWQSQYRWNDSGVYQSLGLNNAILSKSWGGVDRTEYRSADHTGRCCKLTSYLKSKQKWACPIGARARSPKTLRPGTFVSKSISSKRQGACQSLQLKNAILRESRSGVDHTKYRSDVHTGRCCKLTSYLKSKPTSKSVVVLLEQDHFYQEYAGQVHLTKSISLKWKGVESIWN